jgi:hypothetical protein
VPVKTVNNKQSSRKQYQQKCKYTPVKNSSSLKCVMMHSFPINSGYKLIRDVWFRVTITLRPIVIIIELLEELISKGSKIVMHRKIRKKEK